MAVDRKSITCLQPSDSVVDNRHPTETVMAKVPASWIECSSLDRDEISNFFHDER